MYTQVRHATDGHWLKSEATDTSTVITHGCTNTHMSTSQPASDQYVEVVFSVLFLFFTKMRHEESGTVSFYFVIIEKNHTSSYYSCTQIFLATTEPPKVHDCAPHSQYLCIQAQLLRSQWWYGDATLMPPPHSHESALHSEHSSYREGF